MEVINLIKRCCYVCGCMMQGFMDNDDVYLCLDCYSELNTEHPSMEEIEELLEKHRKSEI